MALVTFDIGVFFKEIDQREEALNYLKKSLDLQNELYLFFIYNKIILGDFPLEFHL